MSEDKLLRILLVDDEKIIHQSIGQYLRKNGHEVESAFEAEGGLDKASGKDYDLALVDIKMPGSMDGIALLEKLQQARPDLAVVMMSAHGNMELAIQALRYGAADFLPKPIKLLELDGVLEKSKRITELRRGLLNLKENIYGLRAADAQRAKSDRLIGNSEAIKKVRSQIKMAIEGGFQTILVCGETGAGKEVAAREIHFASDDRQCPFIAVSCPALPETLVESELFGHVKGSFTGATTDKPGSFELADGGILFLDEIADLSASAQAKLLRVLETRAVKRIGAAKEKEVSVKVVAATNKPLEELVKRNKIREDLYYRLNTFTIYIPPLRERKEDIVPLATHFLEYFCKRSSLMVENFTKEAEAALTEYSFPGNSRELRNIVERAAVLCKTGSIEPKHLALPEPQTRCVAEEEPVEQTLHEGNGEREKINKVLRECQWNRTRAAQKLGMPYTTLRYKIYKYGLR